MNKIIVRASYESCLNMTARLSAYATSTPFVDALEVNQRQDILATDDLINFCIHARRLIDNVGLVDFAMQLIIRASDNTTLSLWKVIGCLIHHDDLLIIRSQTHMRMLLELLQTTSNEDFWERVTDDLHKKSYSEAISPHIIFKSDKIPYKMICLTDFMQLFSERVIPAVIKKAYDNNLCLIDSPLKDIDTERIPSHFLPEGFEPHAL